MIGMRDASQQKKEKKGYGAVFFVVTMLLALGAGGYVAAWYFANDRTPHSTSWTASAWAA